MLDQRIPSFYLPQNQFPHLRDKRDTNDKQALLNSRVGASIKRCLQLAKFYALAKDLIVDQPELHLYVTNPKLHLVYPIHHKLVIVMSVYFSTSGA